MQNEQAITLKEVAKYVPKRNGKKVHYSTIYRWATKGVRGRVLETTMVGGIRYTTVEAVRRFLDSSQCVPRSNSEELQRAIETSLRQAGV